MAFHDDHPEWGCLVSLIGFIGDSFKVLLKWDRQDDETPFDFCMTKISALAVILLALGGLCGLFLFIYLRISH